MDLYDKLKKNEMLYRQGRIDVDDDGLGFVPTEKEEYSTPNLELGLIRTGLDPLKFSKEMQCKTCGTFFRASRLVCDIRIECPFCWEIGTSREQPYLYPRSAWWEHATESPRSCMTSRTGAEKGAAVRTPNG